MHAQRDNWEWLEAARKLPHLDPDKIVGIVDHFTAGGSGRAIARWVGGLTRVKGKKVAPAKYYAPIIICRDGHVIQQSQFDVLCYHAGGLNKGRFQNADDAAEINDIALGIEHSNFGWLIKDGSTFYRPTKSGGQWVKGKRYPSSSPTPVRAPDHRGAMHYWEPFTDECIQSSIEVHREMVDTFPNIIRENVLRHSDISPDRKTDPGPLFPLEEILDAVFDDGDEDEIVELEARRYYDPDEEICLLPESD